MYLITGAMGTIGSALRKKLLTTRENAFFTDILGQKEEEILDIRDTDRVKEMIDRCDSVIHLADVVGVDRVNLQSLSDFENLLQGHLHLIRACAESGKRLVLASSSEVYGSIKDGIMRETDHVFLPESIERRHLYARSKLLMEAYARQCFEHRIKDLLIVRFFNVVGPRQKSDHGFVIPRFVEAALKNEPLLVYGDGKAVRYFCHVDDAVEALLFLMNHPTRQFSLYNIGAENGFTMFDVAQRVVNLLQSDSTIKLVPQARTSDVLFRRPDLSRLKNEFPERKIKSLDEIVLVVAKEGLLKDLR